MAGEVRVRKPFAYEPQENERPADPCILVIFGASGDLTKRLLMPALYNLACDGLLPKGFAIAGMAMDALTTEEFRARMSKDIRLYSTRQTFDDAAWDQLAARLHYVPGRFEDLETGFRGLAQLVATLDREQGAGGNVLFYMATPPSVFGLISKNLDAAGFKSAERGWRRIIVEKPFGHDLPSAIALNREILSHWREDQVYRIDHYLGKETVQNLLAFRFSNGIFEPLWNKTHVDHIQFTVAETVGVEARGRYYEGAGVVRDMMQNHMFQMLAYLCMEPPASFRPDAIRNEKAKLLEAVRVMTPDEVRARTVRGQYGPGRKPDGTAAAGYRQEPDVAPDSNTETFAAAKLSIDNWRWEGVPVYLRSGKSLWKRGTEILVQFKKAPEVIFRDTPAMGRLDANQLIFHIQPDQGIELRFSAKSPGPSMCLQPVDMHFDYREAFEASRGTGYEVLLYNCMIGDATLFSRTDLVETAWRIAQPILDVWAAERATGFPNYAAGSWGPAEAFDLLERDGRRWLEVINRDVLEKVPLFQGCGPVFLRGLAIMLEPDVVAKGDYVIRFGDEGREMYVLSRGEVEVLDEKGKRLATLREGDAFGEMSLLSSAPRNASVRALTDCDLFVLDKAEFLRSLREYPEFAKTILEISRSRYSLADGAEQLLDPGLQQLL